MQAQNNTEMNTGVLQKATLSIQIRSDTTNFSLELLNSVVGLTNPNVDIHSNVPSTPKGIPCLAVHFLPRNFYRYCFHSY